ncbi:histidine phosphatase family protein [Roseomonas sp. SSH11]|uniref:Histidine phosphatase family protein n=1 Tax=Pararoseomonas baculiformis TaxID=2820812 RepID=A0ABS4A9M9_9PROT|nr:histidine phosphatase family protein [Pararoseomonas baculiformis]MBP0443682.1 histidine phosphatase family protein [Pararoseomonas baculiformis]
MRQLLLLRHAKSAWDDPALSDHARPLNARGRRAAAAMAAAMRDLGLHPGLVLVSSSRRTLQTLEGLGALHGPPRVEPLDDLYLAPWTRLMDALREVPDEIGSVLLIAHNPGLHDLAMNLAGPASGPEAAALAEAYPTAALAEFALEEPWASIGPRRARLVRFLQPRDLPEMAG